MTDTAISLAKVWANCIRPSGPKMRLKPAIGLTLSHLGFIFSAEKISPDWKTFPPTPPTIVASMTAPRNGAAAQMAFIPISTPAPASSPPISRCGEAMNGMKASPMELAK